MYIGYTVLKPDMAYSLARSIRKPDQYWLAGSNRILSSHNA